MSLSIAARLARRRSSVGIFLAQVAVVATTLTLLELAWSHFTIDLTGDPGGTASLALSLYAGFFWFGLLGNALAVALLRAAARRRIDFDLLGRAALVGLLGVVASIRFDAWFATLDAEEFPDRTLPITGAVKVAIVVVAFVAVQLAWPRMAPRVAERVPAHVLRAAFWLVVLLAGYWLAYTSLAAIHLRHFVLLAAVALVLSACCLWQSLGAHRLERARRVAFVKAGRVVGVAGLGAALLTSFTACRNPHARFVAFGHCPVAASLFVVARDAWDVDGDGSAPAWLGGDDCAAFDNTRGPLEREVPGDGIDQDCRGGDAPAPDPPRSVDRNELLGLLGPCKPLPQPLSVALITIDALRADAISPELTPNLVKFAARGIEFRRAYSPSSSTNTALNSVFLGKTLSDLGSANVYRDTQFRFDASWPRRFAEAGFHTAGFNFLATPEGARDGFVDFNKKRLDDLGIDNVKSTIASATMTSAVVGLFEAGVNPPFFLWAHYPDAHAPFLDATAAPLPPELTGYRREVAYTDLNVGNLLRAFSSAGLFAGTILVITADHGEELGQRGIDGHGPYAFDSVVRVPLMMRIPGCPAHVFEQPVSTVDLLSNIAALVGVAPTAHPLVAPSRAVVSEVLHPPRFLRVVVDDVYKMIVDVRTGGRVLFDLAADPNETRDLYGARPDLARRLDERYQAWLDRGPS